MYFLYLIFKFLVGESIMLNMLNLI